MWGYQFLEASLQQNFNYGFSTHNSDILIHLSQWQYWWWFWFALVWVTYFFIIFFIISKRTNSFNPVLNTSLRSHGKWGDFLIAIIPLAWCGNILVNSNFILRMIEWQNESSLFTLRIQGKQWYWVYKYDGNAALMIDSAPKNVGNNKWLINYGGESYHADSYYQALNLAAQLEAQKMYSGELNKNETNKESLDLISLYTNNIYSPVKEKKTTLTSNAMYNDQTIKINKSFSSMWKSSLTYTSYIENTSDLVKPSKELEDTKSNNEGNDTISQLSYVKDLKENINKTLFVENIYECLEHTAFSKKQRLVTYTDLCLKTKPQTINHYDFIRIDETQNFAGNSRLLLANNPLIIHLGILNEHVISLLQSKKKLDTPYFFTFQINNNFMESKVLPVENYWGFRQKKYKRTKEFAFVPAKTYDPITFEINGENTPLLQKKYIQDNKVKQLELIGSENIEKYYGVLSHKSSIDQPYTDTNLEVEKRRLFSRSNPYNYYYGLRLNKKRSEVLSVTLARRLLRTKRTLVLPAHVNITLITSSYDVVHSWFIPGLGLKLDCVPGRSTHHMLYVDNVGFYYGQCAEICGRYHHHMPIRLCAVPFEQFLVWWHTRGLPRTVRLFNDSRLKRILLKKQMADPSLQLTSTDVDQIRKVNHKNYIKYRYNF